MDGNDGRIDLVFKEVSAGLKNLISVQILKVLLEMGWLVLKVKLEMIRQCTIEISLMDFIKGE